MKTLIGLILCAGGAVMVLGCVGANRAPESDLYKDAEARRVCHASYDRTMTLMRADWQEEWVETPWGSTHVIVAGPADAPPLFLLPGLYADATMWYPNIGPLAREYRVHALDVMLYGGKSRPNGQPVATPEAMADWFGAVIRHYGFTQVPVAGLSYGSWTALTIAQVNPDLVSALLLLDPSESFMPMDGGIAWKGFWSFMFFPNRQKYAEFFTWLGGGYTDPDMEVWFAHLLDVIEFGTAAMERMPRKLYEPADLALVRMPTLVMAGGKPILYKDPTAFAAAASRALPQAKVVIVPDAGHGLNMEKPALVNGAMLDFLRNLPIRTEP